MPRSPRPADVFCEDFFLADGKHPNGTEAHRLFLNAFVPPPRFASLKQWLTRCPGPPRLVFLDGHPCSGKTFSAARAVADLIDEQRLTPDHWWTAGQDSYKVCPRYETDLGRAVAEVERQLVKCPHLKELRYVLLDDLLGTQRPRPLLTAKDLPVKDAGALRPYFTHDRDTNPWLRLLPDGCTVVITGRSLFFLILEAFLDLDVRNLGAGPAAAAATTHRWGTFRTHSGDLAGAVDRTTVAEISKRNRANHPLKEHERLLFQAAPLLAFDFDPDHRPLGPEQTKLRAIAAEVLFGEDMYTLAKLVGEFRGKSRDWIDAPQWSREARRKVETAYVMSLAPGLLFLGPEAHEALAIDRALGQQLADSLYFSDRELQSGRLPNELYMPALDKHLGTYAPGAIEAFVACVRSTAEASNKSVSAFPGIGLGLRGLIERGRCPYTHPPWEELRAIPAFIDLFQDYQTNQRKRDFLLDLEFSERVPRGAHESNPGLAAAVGWALYKFFRSEQHRRVRRAAQDWFQDCLQKLNHRLRDATPGADRGWDTLAAFYSTFLQWAIKMRAVEDLNLVNEVVTGADLGRRRAPWLRLILDDQLVGAVLDRGYDLSDLTRDLESALTEKPSGDWDDAAKKRELATRLLSLAWHNRWMGPSGALLKAWKAEALEATRRGDPEPVRLQESAWKDFTDMARDWLEQHRDRALQLVREEPALIEFALQYHWCHFLTQRAVWMRDWCLEEDPNLYERSPGQITAGAPERRDNRLLADIADALIQGTAAHPGGPRSVRNILLLIGSRWDRLPNGRLVQLLDQVDHQLHAAGERSALLYHVLQAIFELSRQGFLDPRRAGLAPDRVTDCQAFLRWCWEKLNETTVGSAWRSYREGLREVTHPLDLLPREDGWEDVRGALAEFLAAAPKASPSTRGTAALRRPTATRRPG
jgi:hypothetical protein